jgi:catechol 2,3-dioxygenase-like lactoylglutathione lyase family enzyme
MALTRLEHYLVLTDNVDATRDFYCNVLGMQVGPRPPLEFPGYWVYLGDVPCIHIADWERYATHSAQTGIPVSKRSEGTGPVDHLAFNANNYPEIRDRLHHHGVPAHTNVVPGANLIQLFLNDPNGVKIEINIFSATTEPC